MKLRTRKGRRVLRYRRQGRQVLAVCALWEGPSTDFKVLYWVPTAHGRLPRGCQR